MQLLTTRDIAIKLNVHEETVRRYLREHRIKSVKIGNQYRVQEFELDEFIRALNRT